LPVARRVALRNFQIEFTARATPFAARKFMFEAFGVFIIDTFS
jgi:hypothetical protein